MVKAVTVIKIGLKFFATDAGKEVVRDWLRALPEEERHAIGLDLMHAQFAWPVGMPLCRPLGDGLFEIRTSLDDKTARVFICYADGVLVALHGIIKKTEQTPLRDLKLARKRLKLVID